MANRYVNCLIADGQPRALDLSEPAAPEEWPESVYFRRAFQALDRLSSGRDFTFYLTNDVERLPSYGRDVVAIVVGDEHCRIPLYLHRVAAVFHSCGTRPRLGCRPVREPSLVNLLSLLVYARRCAKCMPGLVYYASGLLTGRRREFAPFREIPLGTANQEELSMRALADRSTTVFFAGSVAHNAYRPSRIGAVKDAFSPKRAARRAMLDSLSAASERDPRLRVKTDVAHDFNEAIHSDGHDYSTQLMNAQISLVPRGAAPQTFRFFQAMRAGCVVITDVEPSQRFFAGAPVVRLKRWDELAKALRALVDDPDRLARHHRESLEWWARHCSEEAAARYVADVLVRTGEPSARRREWPSRTG